MKIGIKAMFEYTLGGKVKQVAGGGLVLEKPKFGEKCNSCGLCCTIQPCLLAEQFLNCFDGPCVALEEESDGRKTCGLVKRPAHYMFGEDAPQSLTGGFQVMLANMLGIGRGCDASDDVSSPQPSLTQPETDNT
jgi:hypothetical protein